METPTQAAASSTQRPAVGGDDQDMVNALARDDEYVFDLIARARTDPVIARQVCDLQARLFVAFEKMVQGAVDILIANEAGSGKKGGAMQGGPISVAALAGASKLRAAESKRRRELAQAMMIGALINIDNPGWDPLDPSTSKRSDKNGLLALMELDLHGEVQARVAAEMAEQQEA
jgi:hypothetical protein